MLLEVDLFSGVKKLLAYNNIISISGESGTGKTTLALQLIGRFMTYEEPFVNTCVWIQAGEKFPLRRLTQLFSQKRRLDYIHENIFVIPPQNPIRTHNQQTSIIQHLIDPEGNIPHSLKYIVIDNISHHLRYKLTQYNNAKDASSLLNTFYETQLMPLMLFCTQQKITLILIHEVTYSPKDQYNRPFFYKLYDRIDMINIVLHNILIQNRKNLQIIYDAIEWNFQYSIGPQGVAIKTNQKNETKLSL